MKYSFHLFIVSFAILVFIGCNNDSPNENSANSDSASTENGNADCGTSAKFKIDAWPEDSMGVPHSVITVDGCNMTVTLDTIVGSAQLYERTEFKDMEIPSEAIQACGAWFAGGGDYYYIVPISGGGVTVFHGWLDEGQEDSGYHWKAIQEIGKPMNASH